MKAGGKASCAQRLSSSEKANFWCGKNLPFRQAHKSLNASKEQAKI